MGYRMFKAPCLKVHRVLGDKAIKLVRMIHLFDPDLRVQQVEDYVYIPLISTPTTESIKMLGENLSDFEVSAYKFPKRLKRPLKLVEVLRNTLPSHLLSDLPHSIDFVGDIAVLDLPPRLEDYRGIIGNAILETNKRVHTVVTKSSAVEGVYRVRTFKAIAGVGKTETIHREYGCMYHLDLAKVYFSPRLSHEHNRVASQVKDGETVVDMFAGVGPFSILTAKQHDDVTVYAIDINPNAIRYLKKNIAVNRVHGRVLPILSDVKQVVNERLTRISDRVIMNLPEKAIEYIDSACKLLKPKGGVIHYYEFTGAPDPLNTARIRLEQAIKQNNRSLEKVLMARIVRATAPFTWQVVVDAQIR